MKRDEVPQVGAASGTKTTNPPEAENTKNAAAPVERPFGLRRAAATPVVARPKMRADLRFVHEGPAADTGQRLPGRLRIIDLRNDRRFDFDAQEHFLCTAADGLASPEDLQLRLQNLTDHPLTAVQVAKFFRRLNILGLLEPDEAAPVVAPAMRLRNRAARAPAVTVGDVSVAKPTGEPTGSKLTLVRSKKAESGAPAPKTAAAEVAKPVSVPAPEPLQPAPDPAPSARRFVARRPSATVGRVDDPADGVVSHETGFGGAEAQGRFAGRMRRNIGGMGGGMGGMPGGMGGGMGAMPGGMMAMGGMGAGMRGMRGRMAPEPQAKELGPTQLPLFNPDLLFRVLYYALWPLKFFLWMLLPLTVFAGMTLIQKMPEVASDVSALIASSGLVMTLLIGLFVNSFGSRVAQGLAITANSGRVKSIGINLLLGFFPRFYIDDSAVARLDRKGQIWAFAAPLMFRLSLFVFGILFWAVSRDSGGSAPMVALVVAKFGLVMFLITAWPMIPGDGMRFMGAVLGEPRLLAKSIMAARAVFLKGRLPPTIRRDDAWPLALFAVGTVLTTSLILGLGAIFILMALQSRLDGLGVSIFLALMLAATLWVLAMSKTKSRQQKATALGGMAGAMGGQTGTMTATGGKVALRGPDLQPGEGDHVAGRADLDPAQAGARPATKTAADALPNRAGVVWAVIACGLLVAAFLPYRYEAGGRVEILPAARGTAVARTDGEVVEVFVAQGDRVVAGTPLVRLSDWDQLASIAVTEAQLAGAQAELAKLEAGSQPEQIDVAKAKLARSEAMASLRKAEVERARSLVASQAVSAAAVEKTEADYAATVADVEADRAFLALTLAGATSEELQIARAAVDRLERELAYDKGELQRTLIVSPMDGTVVTADLNLRVGDYLKIGDEFLAIEKTDVVTATISIPEADIGFIKPGQSVRLRAESQSEIEVTGEIRQVAPVAEDAGYGRIVRATAVFPNSDGLLRSSMTGWAKIEGSEMLVWEAYLRTIVRFAKIDVWSWIP